MRFALRFLPIAVLMTDVCFAGNPVDLHDGEADVPLVEHSNAGGSSVEVLNPVRLISKEGKEFFIPKESAMKSTLLRTMIVDDDGDEIQDIPLPNVNKSYSIYMHNKSFVIV